MEYICMYVCLFVCIYLCSGPSTMLPELHLNAKVGLLKCRRPSSYSAVTLLTIEIDSRLNLFYRIAKLDIAVADTVVLQSHDPFKRNSSRKVLHHCCFSF